MVTAATSSREKPSLQSSAYSSLEHVSSSAAAAAATASARLLLLLLPAWAVSGPAPRKRGVVCAPAWRAERNQRRRLPSLGLPGPCCAGTRTQQARCCVAGVRGVLATPAGPGPADATGKQQTCPRRGVRERTPQRRLAVGVHGVLGVRGVRAAPLLRPRTSPPLQQLMSGNLTLRSASGAPDDGLW